MYQVRLICRADCSKFFSFSNTSTQMEINMSMIYINFMGKNKTPEEELDDFLQFSLIRLPPHLFHFIPEWVKVTHLKQIALSLLFSIEYAALMLKATDDLCRILNLTGTKKQCVCLEFIHEQRQKGFFSFVSPHLPYK